MLDQVVEVLNWDGAGSLPDEIYVRTVERLSGAFRSTLARLQPVETARVDALIAQIRSVPDDSFLRFLTAPETFGRLVNFPHDDFGLLSFAEESMLAEVRLCGQETTSDPPGWTALGDYYFPGSGKPFDKATFPGGIPVDFSSPYASSADIPVADPVLPFPPEERRKVVDNIEAALEGVAQSSAAADALVRLFTRTIVVRKNAGEPDRFLSSSSPRYVGRTLLCNPDRASVEELAEAFVHEAIHGLLAGVQIESPFVYNNKKVATLDIVSPWTRNIIPGDAFVDACFVWYGLWRLWEQVSGADCFRREEAERLLARARSGFEGAPLIDMLSEVRTSLSAALFSTIEAMQDAVSVSAPCRNS